MTSDTHNKYLWIQACVSPCKSSSHEGHIFFYHANKFKAIHFCVNFFYDFYSEQVIVIFYHIIEESFDILKLWIENILQGKLSGWHFLEIVKPATYCTA